MGKSAYVTVMTNKCLEIHQSVDDSMIKSKFKVFCTLQLDIILFESWPPCFFIEKEGKVVFFIFTITDLTQFFKICYVNPHHLKNKSRSGKPLQVSISLISMSTKPALPSTHLTSSVAIGKKVR